MYLIYCSRCKYLDYDVVDKKNINKMGMNWVCYAPENLEGINWLDPILKVDPWVQNRKNNCAWFKEK